MKCPGLAIFLGLCFAPVLTRAQFVDDFLSLVAGGLSEPGFLEKQVLPDGRMLVTRDTAGTNPYDIDGCARDCRASPSPKTCHYKFTVNLMETIGKWCQKCPLTKSDCNALNCLPCNGKFRELMIVGRSLPGPIISVCLGDTVIVTVKNANLGAAITIHWQGQHQKGTAYSDGMPMGTQCPILPDTSYQYKFKATEVGTHFYHSGQGMQISDGLFGALIVRNPNPSSGAEYDIDDDDHVMIFGDFQPDLGDMYHVAPAYPLNTKATTARQPIGMICNGKGRYWKPNSSVALVETDVAEFWVMPGKRYRFRLIHAGVLACPIKVLFDQHSMRVIATGGGPIVPVDAEAIILYPGARYDVVIETTGQSGTNYLILFLALGECLLTKGYDEMQQVALLRYQPPSFFDTRNSLLQSVTYESTVDAMNKASPVLNCLDLTPNPACISLNSLSSKPGVVDSSLLVTTPDKKVFLGSTKYEAQVPFDGKFLASPLSGIATYQPDNGTFTLFGINHCQRLVLPSPPLLYWDELQDVITAKRCPPESCEPGKFQQCFHMIEFDRNQTVELIITNCDPQIPMSFTLHGHSFALVGMGQVSDPSITDVAAHVKELDSQGQLPRNLENPLMKDVIPVTTKGWAVVRFSTDNPGIWLYRSTVRTHRLQGMAVAVKVGPPSEFPKPPEENYHCGNFA